VRSAELTFHVKRCQSLPTVLVEPLSALDTSRDSAEANAADEDLILILFR
jgi:hypothetical protein